MRSRLARVLVLLVVFTAPAALAGDEARLTPELAFGEELASGAPTRPLQAYSAGLHLTWEEGQAIGFRLKALTGPNVTDLQGGALDLVARAARADNPWYGKLLVGGAVFNPRTAPGPARLHVGAEAGLKATQAGVGFELGLLAQAEPPLSSTPWGGSIGFRVALLLGAPSPGDSASRRPRPVPTAPAVEASQDKPAALPSGPGPDPVLVSISGLPPASPTACPEVPGEPANPRLLVNLVRQGCYPQVQNALDACSTLERDDVSRQVVAALSDDELDKLARPAEGNSLLVRLYDELTSGHITEEETCQSLRLEGAEVRRRYPSPEAFVEDSTRAFVFGSGSMGLTNLGTPLRARRRPDGTIDIQPISRSAGNSLEEGLAFSSNGHVLEPDQEVVIRLYDEGGVSWHVPALGLLRVSNADDVHLVSKVLEAAALGLMLGTCAPGVSAAEAAAATRALVPARALAVCDRVALAVGVTTSLVLEHRGWVLSRFGEEGRAFLYGMEFLNGALAFYTVARVAVNAPELVDAVRGFYGPVATAARLQRQAARLTPQEVAELDSFLRKTERLFEDLETIRRRSPGAGAPGQAGPPQAGGKVLRFPDRLRQPGQPPEAGAQPLPAEARESLAPTGTDGPPVVNRGQGSTRDAPVASLKRTGQDGTRGPPAPSTTPPGPPSNTVSSPPVPPPGRTVPERAASESTPRLPVVRGEREPGATLATEEAGPGEWIADAKESMPADSRAYQAQVTGHPEGSAYVVRGVKMPDGKVTDVKFDGFVPGKEFQECKGPGYTRFLDKKKPGRFQWWFERSQRRGGGMVPQAKRQLEAAKGTLPVRWYVAEREVADAIRNLLRDNDVREVEVIFRPFLAQKGY